MDSLVARRNGPAARRDGARDRGGAGLDTAGDRRKERRGVLGDCGGSLVLELDSPELDRLHRASRRGLLVQVSARDGRDVIGADLGQERLRESERCWAVRALP